MLERKNIERLDAAELMRSGRFDEKYSYFLAEQLRYVRAAALKVKKAPLKAFEVFPVTTDIPVGAKTAVQRIYDSVGMAKIISNYGDDLPRIDILAAEKPVHVRTLGAAYGYSVTDLQNAQFAGMNINAEKAEAAREAIDRKINAIAWKGDAEYGITGFIDNPNLTEYTVAASGTGSSTKFIDKTDEQIIADLNGLAAAVETATSFEEHPNTLLLPPKAYTIVSTKRLSYSDHTILDFFRAAHPNITRVIAVGELEGASSSGKDIMVAGFFDPKYIKLEIPIRFEQMPIQYRNLEYVIDCIASTTGVTVQIPNAFAKAEGV